MKKYSIMIFLGSNGIQSSGYTMLIANIFCCLQLNKGSTQSCVYP